MIMRFLFRTKTFIIIWTLTVLNIYAQESSMKSPYFKVLKSENIDFKDFYNYSNQILTNEIIQKYFKNIEKNHATF